MLNNMEYNVKFVALYIRKSRADNEDDLMKHRTILTDLCTKNNFKYVEYAEVGTSDSIDMRPKMTQLLKDVEAGVYDAVCSVDYDRLGRGDLGEQDRIKKAFQKSNTLIITPEKVYDLNNDLDDTYADFKGLFARQEYKMISKRFKQGKMVGSRRGNWTNGTPPYPYEYEKYKDKYNEKGLVINDEKLKVYRQIIELYISGNSTTQISNILNNQNILSPRHMKWNNLTVSRLLVDETHLGKIISNKSIGDGHKTKKPNAKQLHKNSKDQWIIIENCHDPVKTQSEHDKILKLILDNNKMPSRTKQSVFAFSGLIKCGRCGHTHSFLTKPNGNVLMKPCWFKDPYGNKCINKGIMEKTLEELVINKVKQYLSIYSLQNNFDNTEDIKIIQDNILSKTNELDKYLKALDKVNEMYEIGDYNKEEWRLRKEKWNKKIKLIRKEINDLNIQLKATSNYNYEEDINNLKKFVNDISLADTPQKRNQLYKSIVNKIIWICNETETILEIVYKRLL
jgi:DNA invertase Pin-like site-specific DNA recombinase